MVVLFFDYPIAICNVERGLFPYEFLKSKNKLIIKMRCILNVIFGGPLFRIGINKWIDCKLCYLFFIIECVYY